MKHIPKFHIPEAFKRQVKLQPNPHKSHDFKGVSPNTFMIDDLGRSHPITRVEEAMMESLRPTPDINELMRQQGKTDARFVVEPSLLIAGEIAQIRIHDLHPDGSYTINEELTTMVNRANSSTKSSFQTMAFLNILSKSIILEP